MGEVRRAARRAQIAGVTVWLGAAALCAACSDSEGEDGRPPADAGHGSAQDGSQGAAATQPELAVLAEGQDEPRALAIDDRYVYWTTRSGLRRAPLAGGATVSLVTSSGLVSIAVARGAVFFTDQVAGTVSWVQREGGPATAIGGGPSPQGIAVDHDASVYWGNNGKSFTDGSIGQVAPGGAPATLLATGLVQPVGLAVDDSFVYFASGAQRCSSTASIECIGGGVHKVQRGGGPAIAIDSREAPQAVAVTKRGAYWMTSTPTQVMFAPADGTGSQTLADVTGEDAGMIAVDDEALYFGSTSQGRVLKVPLEGGEPQRLASDLGTVGGLAVDRDWVYVAATSTGRILRIAKD